MGVVEKAFSDGTPYRERLHRLDVNGRTHELGVLQGPDRHRFLVLRWIGVECSLLTRRQAAERLRPDLMKHLPKDQG